jgi:hypothetical protein
MSACPYEDRPRLAFRANRYASLTYILGPRLVRTYVEEIPTSGILAVLERTAKIKTGLNCNTHGFPIVMHVRMYGFRRDSYESIHE